MLLCESLNWLGCRTDTRSLKCWAPAGTVDLTSCYVYDEL